MKDKPDTPAPLDLSHLERHHIMTLCEQQVRDYPGFKTYKSINESIISKLKETK
jgi:hypothetical protein